MENLTLLILCHLNSFIFLVLWFINCLPQNGESSHYLNFKDSLVWIIKMVYFSNICISYVEITFMKYLV